MSAIKFFKVTELPTEFEPDSLYFLERPNEKVQVFVTSSSGEPKEVSGGIIVNGGSASSVFGPTQHINGGNANG